MKILIILLTILLNFNVFGQITTNQINKIVDSIYIIEGGANTKYPYGIKSIKTDNPRQICYNTVRNQYIRWSNNGKTNDFLQSLQIRYCPIGAADDPRNLNSNWLKNLKNQLGKDFKIE